ncbi:MAG: DUF58 domain-containing protein [Anaerolineales bacterium]|nr:DUF58 domain-containing protein [Anaerolineales bacterium]
MPTRRAATFLFLAFLLYLFANQTQVGWLYVMSALLAGVVVAAFGINRGALKGLVGTRQIGSGEYEEFYEGEEISISLTLTNPRRTSTAQLRALETCPLADPASEHHALTIFIPALPPAQSTELQYLVEIYRRGLHEFPPLALSTRAPFGLFHQKRTLPLPTPLLVYPELHRLTRLDLLDRQPSVNLTRPRAGWGTEVIGVRPYRPGDSPRHIHWRSVARLAGRSGQLISKEFVDESQPGLTLALDLFPHSLPTTDSKHTPFEWMVKLAASIGEYAIRRGYALHLLTDETAWPAPHGPVTRQALLEFLARVHPAGEYPLAQLLTTRNTQTFVAAIFPYPDPNALAPLLSLKQQGVQLLTVLPDPATFPVPGPSAAPLADELTAVGIETRLVYFGENWATQLAPLQTSILS